VAKAAVTSTRGLTLGPISFRTKKDAKSHLQALMKRSVGQGPIRGEDHVLLCELLQRHSTAQRKIGPGIKYFFARRDPNYGGESLQLMLVRLDGSLTDISWNDCLNGTNRRAQVMGALREAILDDIIAVKRDFFADGRPHLCEYTDELLTQDNAHVDHEFPLEFASLVKVWLAQQRLTVEQIALMSHPDGAGQVMADLQQRACWKAFHQQYVRLKVISETANVRIRRQRKATLVDLGAWALSHGDQALVDAVHVALQQEGLRDA
jgi:hypothetical protein